MNTLDNKLEHSKENHELAVINLEQELDILVVPALKAELDGLIDQGYCNFILNFSQVRYIDSSGIGLLIYLQRVLDDMGASLSMIHMSDSIMRILSYVQLLERNPSTAMLGSMYGCQERLKALPLDIPASSSSIKVPRDPSKMCEVRAQLTHFLEELSLDESYIFDMVLAAGEALGNAFDHAFEHDTPCPQRLQGDMQIILTMSSYDDRVILEISDSGSGFYPELDKLPEPSAMRGRGVRLMCMLTDLVEIGPRRHGQGTCVRLIKLK